MTTLTELSDAELAEEFDNLRLGEMLNRLTDAEWNRYDDVEAEMRRREALLLPPRTIMVTNREWYPVTVPGHLTDSEIGDYLDANHPEWKEYSDY